jgi:6-pyruvoyltetrahydropterin/6-carboxytetrahydropterin synthase
MPASLTRAVGFHAVHRVDRQTDLHGHDYRCAVTITGPLDESGMIVDLTLLDGILTEEVLQPFAGKNLNLDVPAFANGRPLPTCEAMATYLFGRIVPRLPAGVRLERVRIAEDATLYADCTRIA